MIWAWMKEHLEALPAAGTAVWIAFAATPAKAGETGQPPAPAQAQSSNHSRFEDKATGGWRGERQRLAQSGVSIDAELVLEGFRNFRGGLDSTRFVGASTFDLNGTLDTGKAFGLKGGEFYVDLEDHAGQNPSTELVGDLQVFDKLNTRPYLQVFELWYQQQLFDGRVRLKLGKVDANTEFSVIDNGLPFINSSSQVSPTVFVLPTTPDPMPSVNLFIRPVRSFYAGFGAYYANRSEGFGNFTGHPQAAQATEFGSFLIGETGLRWRHDPVAGRDGNLKLGAWWHTGEFSRLDGTRQRGAGGWYAIFDQTLWQPSGERRGGRGLRSFLEYGWTQSTVNVIDWHTGGGFAWTGPLDGRPEDIAGVCAQYAHLSPEAGLPHPYELALETFYHAKVLKWAGLMPDFQYIFHPGGRYPDAVVGALRLTVDF